MSTALGVQRKVIVEGEAEDAAARCHGVSGLAMPIANRGVRTGPVTSTRLGRLPLDITL